MPISPCRKYATGQKDHCPGLTYSWLIKRITTLVDGLKTQFTQQMMFIRKAGIRGFPGLLNSGKVKHFETLVKYSRVN